MQIQEANKNVNWMCVHMCVRVNKKSSIHRLKMSPQMEAKEKMKDLRKDLV